MVLGVRYVGLPLGGPSPVPLRVTVYGSKLGFNTGARWVSGGIMLYHTPICLFGGFNGKGGGVLTTGGMIRRVISVWEVLAHDSPDPPIDPMRKKQRKERITERDGGDGGDSRRKCKTEREG